MDWGIFCFAIANDLIHQELCVGPYSSCHATCQNDVFIQTTPKPHPALKTLIKQALKNMNLTVCKMCGNVNVNFAPNLR